MYSPVRLRLQANTPKTGATSTRQKPTRQKSIRQMNIKGVNSSKDQLVKWSIRQK